MTWTCTVLQRLRPLASSYSIIPTQGSVHLSGSTLVIKNMQNYIRSPSRAYLLPNVTYPYNHSEDMHIFAPLPTLENAEFMPGQIIVSQQYGVTLSCPNSPCPEEFKSCTWKSYWLTHTCYLLTGRTN